MRIDELTSEYEKELLEYGLVITELETIENLGVPGIAERLEITKQLIDDLYCERNYLTVYALAKETLFHANRKTGEATYSYDNQGLLIQIDIDSDGQEAWNEELDVYEYILYADGIVDRSLLFEYDDNGNVIKKSRTYPQHDIYRPEDCYEYRYEYDENDNIRTCTEYYDGTLSPRAYTCEFKWENGLLIEENLSSADSTEINIGTYCYLYDDNGRIMTYTIKEDSDVYIVDLLYNGLNKVEKANVQREWWYSVEQTVSFSYDARGNYIPDAEMEIEYIEYDDYGNISAIQYENGDYIEYEYQKMLVSPDLIWNGGTIAAIRQFAETQDPNRIVPGQNHIACIYTLS